MGELAPRKRRFRISVRALILSVAAVGIGIGLVRRFGPLTPAEAARVAWAEVVRRDPEFARKGRVFSIEAGEVNAGRPWNLAHRWDITMKRDDSATGYMVSVNGRSDVKVARAWDISRTHVRWDMPR